MSKVTQADCVRFKKKWGGENIIYIIRFPGILYNFRRRNWTVTVINLLYYFMNVCVQLRYVQSPYHVAKPFVSREFLYASYFVLISLLFSVQVYV